MRAGKFIDIIFTSLLLCTLFTLVSCEEKSTRQDTQVTTFTFQTSTDAPDLKNIYFYVDTLRRQIYNLDSVAYTSDITSVVPVISCYDSPSEIRVNGYYWNQVDPLNVSAPFQITIVSSDTKISTVYTVTVVKHKVDPSLIYWTKLDTNIPSNSFTDGKGALLGDEFIFTGIDKSAKQQVYSSKEGAQWTLKSEGTQNVKVSTIYSPINSYAPDSIFAVGVDGNLYYLSSNDYEFKKVDAELPPGYTLVDVIGEYFNTILVLAKNGSSGVTLAYNGNTLTERSTGFNFPSSFPFDGSSAKCTVIYDESTGSNIHASFVLGGYSGASTLTNGVFSSDDGTYWVNTVKSDDYAPEAASNTSAVWYDGRIFRLGGLTKYLEASDDYVSYDKGYSWEQTSEYEQYPEESGFVYGISTLRDAAADNIYLIGGFSLSDEYIFKCYKGRAVHKDFIRK